MEMPNGDIFCDDCGGWDVEWMRRCKKHGTHYCRGCECPVCAEDKWEESLDEYYSMENTER